MKTNYFFSKGLVALTITLELFFLSFRVNAQVYEFDFTDYKVNVTESVPTNGSNLSSLFDNDLSTSYVVPAGGQVVTVELAYPILLSGYAVKTTTSSMSVDYSLTGITWEPIASTGDPIDKDGYIFYVSEFAFEKSYATKYYRLTLGQGIVNEWQLFGVPVVSSEYDFPDDLISIIGGTAQFSWANTTMAGSSVSENIFNRKYGNGDEYRASFNVNNGPLEIKYDFNTAQTVKRYSISTYNTGSYFITRAPKTWKLFGSNSGMTWTEIDSRTDFIFPLLEGNPKRCTTMEFEVLNSTAYKMYKLEIQGQHAYLDLLEVQMFGNLLTSSDAEVPVDEKGISLYQNGNCLTLLSDSEDINYMIYNVNGQIVASGDLIKEEKCQISLLAGIYIVRAGNYSKKFIIQK